MSITAAKTYLGVEPVAPYQGGVLSVANVIDATGEDHSLLGAEYLTDACADGGIWEEICYAVEQNLCEGLPQPTPPMTQRLKNQVPRYL